MTVKELIKMLQKIEDKNAEVFIHNYDNSANESPYDIKIHKKEYHGEFPSEYREYTEVEILY